MLDMDILLVLYHNCFWETYNNGYVDKLTFVSRVKSNSELLYAANLVACYSFDNTYLDFDPNQINNTSGINTTFTSFGRFKQALIMNSMYVSYFETTGFYYLDQTNYPYSYSLWIYLFINNGTILQVTNIQNKHIMIQSFGYSS